MELSLNKALQKGIEAHKAGRLKEADRYYTAILKVNSRHPDANHNMGVLAVGVGKLSEALPFFKTALEINPNIAQYWLSYIDALIKLHRTMDAKAVFNEAKSKGAKGDGFDQIQTRLGLANKSNAQSVDIQDPPQNQLQALVNFYTQRKFENALNEASQLLTKYPHSAVLHNIIGGTKQALRKFDEAIASYKKAISIKPDYSQAFYNIGVTLQGQGKSEEAIASYKEAHAIEPNYVDAYNNMGNALKSQGRLEEAVASYREALAISPDYITAFNNLGVALEGAIFKKPNPALQGVITYMLNEKTYVRPINIARAAVSLLKLDPNLQKQLPQVTAGELSQDPSGIILELNEIPLLLKLMKVCPLPDLELEKLLTILRASILENISSYEKASNEFLIFQSALALQCFTNEYIYTTTHDEERKLQALEKVVEKTIKSDGQPTPLEILVLASYKALNQYKWCNLLIVTDEIQEVFTRQIIELKKEEDFKSQVPVLEEITDSISSKVREQYEENPYPRWVNLLLPSEPSPISKVTSEINLKIYDKQISSVEAPNILIAGCGTGQHSIFSAKRFKSSKVLAIDLSLSSLGYAQLKTDEFAIGNIEYMQADILNARDLNRQFDIIESSGVLHHMNDPMEGWKVLVDCLRPSGLMKIGLYSKVARQQIIKIRGEINELGIGSGNSEMKHFRDRIIASDEDHHKMIQNSYDFYNLSTLKDLLFHVQEHQFTISQIKGCLVELGLKFCGFENSKTVSHFKLINKEKDDPYNLDKWHLYEEANPSAFNRMYQFWCQKVD